jgi:hypothetical protein
MDGHELVEMTPEQRLNTIVHALGDVNRRLNLAETRAQFAEAKATRLEEAARRVLEAEQPGDGLAHWRRLRDALGLPVT